MSVFLVLAFCLSGCEGCAAPVAGPDAGEEPGIACRFNSDCGERSFCGDEGFCLDGLPEGQCLEQSDCPEEFLCVFPDGSDVGACVNPHGCDDNDGCDDGQECVVNSEGFRQCQYTGCESDDECAIELGSTCTQNEEAKCIARACQCRDLCGADCGEGRQCCAIEGASPMCMGDPGACSKFHCDDGLIGTTPDQGEWNARVCDYDTAVCGCEELPPLPVGRVGMPHQLLHLDDERYAVVAYNATYGDLVIGFMDEGEVREWTIIAGVPERSEDAPIVAGPSGPRGGIEAPGDDIGAHLDAVVHPITGEVHILATDHTNGTLLHFYGPADGPFVSRILETDDEPGHFPKLFLHGSGEAAYAHVAARNDAGESTLFVSAVADFSTAPGTFYRYELRSSALDDVHCQGGCSEGFVRATAPVLDGISVCLPEAADCDCMGGDVCSSTGCKAPGTTTSFAKAQTTDAMSLLRNGAGAVLFFHDTRSKSLNVFQSSGNLYDGSAAFSESTLVSVVDDDMGRNV
ncbi:MAG: hypothetical protein GY822_12505, partial [Deltaproteobacteria bacterium]|nr:hypothetical protein [Deltaproteobacteria bacterium]